MFYRPGVETYRLGVPADVQNRTHRSSVACRTLIPGAIGDGRVGDDGEAGGGESWIASGYGSASVPQR